MLARVTGGKQGIADYLKNGIKSGRELSRDELDLRVVLDGDLELTHKVISELSIKNKPENYYHITLSFGEKDISNEKIEMAYQDYKQKIMSAYDLDEYNIYAEIHQPKVKNYRDKRTNELVERFPHVHVVIPKTNLITDKNLNPFGLYKDNIKTFDAIQESVNRKFNLESPYDHQKKYQLTDKSEFRLNLFETINKNDIRDMKSFKKELEKIGVVGKGVSRVDGEYLTVKPFGESKNIRLKNNCFKHDYIENRILEIEKPTDKTINNLVADWVENKSLEMKFIHPSSSKNREIYYKLSLKDKEVMLNDQQQQYRARYRGLSSRGLPTGGLSHRGLSDEQYKRGTGGRGADDTDIQPRRFKVHKLPSLNRPSGFESKKFTDITNGLPSLSKRPMARGNGRSNSKIKSVLPNNENNNLVNRRASRDHQLRWTRDKLSRRIGRRLNNDFKHEVNHKPLFTKKNKVSIKNASDTYIQQLINDQKSKIEQTKEVQFFDKIRKNLRPNALLKHFEKEVGLNPDDYRYFKAKDGTYRIKTGSRNLNLTDFCTKHMHKSWAETKSILTTKYNDQLQEKQNKIAFNQIIFASNRLNNRYVKNNGIAETLAIFEKLKSTERYNNMNFINGNESKNQIARAVEQPNLSVIMNEWRKDATDKSKRERELSETMASQLKMNDLIAKTNTNKSKLTFSDKNTGDVAFTETNNAIVMKSRDPLKGHIGLALEIAAEKYGRVNITGSKQFKENVINVAVEKDLNIVFKNKEMQERFIELKGHKNAISDARQLTPEQIESKLDVNPTLKAQDLNDSIKSKEPSQEKLKGQETKESKELSAIAYALTYKWSREKYKMGFLVNDKNPNEIDPKILDKIVKQDRFLQLASKDEIKNGFVDVKSIEKSDARSLPQNQAISKNFDKQGDMIQNVNSEKAETLK